MEKGEIGVLRKSWEKGPAGRDKADLLWPSVFPCWKRALLPRSQRPHRLQLSFWSGLRWISWLIKRWGFRLHYVVRLLDSPALDCIRCHVLSRVWLFATPWTVACQTPLSIGFSRQEYRSGLPFPPPGHLPSPGVTPPSLASPVLQALFYLLRLY